MPTQFTPTKPAILFLQIGAIAGLLTLLLQFYLILLNRIYPVLTTVINYFSYFTILTNILVMVCCFSLVSRRNAFLHNLFSRPTMLTATCVYITVVGLVYNIILRPLGSPQGWSKVADEMLHLIIPIYFVIFWILFVPKSSLTWRDVLPWLIYPLVYCFYTLLRGAAMGWYPYPFINAADLGYRTTIINSVGVSVAFLVVALLYIAIGKLMSRRT